MRENCLWPGAVPGILGGGMATVARMDTNLCSQFGQILATLWPVVGQFGQLLTSLWPVFGQFVTSFWPVCDQLLASFWPGFG